MHVIERYIYGTTEWILGASSLPWTQRQRRRTHLLPPISKPASLQQDTMKSVGVPLYPSLIISPSYPFGYLTRLV